MGEWLLALLAPERVQQFGIAATALLTAWTARQSSQVKKLQAEVAELKAGRAEDREKFREAIRFIRQLLRHIEHLDAFLSHHAPGQQPPDTRPAIPVSLEKEI
ncbi:hypothetical protein M1M07_28450 [Rhodococcus sp. HM1]|uniref:hypothetical protein n=1 Tax=Rhodococcus sp. HM1 TaxID=2937759 RepID=UPI00200A7FC5|nr:hypothetical protein [Rhodococcus sp. HM1]MCK8675026.1 hypothetical protein [Rhodococcus sp. HM1]